MMESVALDLDDIFDRDGGGANDEDDDIGVQQGLPDVDQEDAPMRKDAENDAEGLLVSATTDFFFFSTFVTMQMCVFINPFN